MQSQTGYPTEVEFFSWLVTFWTSTFTHQKLDEKTGKYPKLILEERLCVVNLPLNSWIAVRSPQLSSLLLPIRHGQHWIDCLKTHSKCPAMPAWFIAVWICGFISIILLRFMKLLEESPLVPLGINCLFRLWISLSYVCLHFSRLSSNWVLSHCYVLYPDNIY